MNRRLLTILTIAFLIAGGCSLLVYRMVGTRVTSANKQTTVRVVAASSDTKLGTVLTAANLTTIEIAGSLPKGVILKSADAIGRGVCRISIRESLSWRAVWHPSGRAAGWQPPFAKE